MAPGTKHSVAHGNDDEALSPPSTPVQRGPGNKDRACWSPTIQCAVYAVALHPVTGHIKTFTVSLLRKILVLYVEVRSCSSRSTNPHPFVPHKNRAYPMLIGPSTL